jgi:hypothetical protein
MHREITPPGPISISEPREMTIEDYKAEIDRLDLKCHELVTNHEKRVTELLRANSEQVIRRREINAHRMKLLEYVSKARDQFRFYARSHREKIPKFEAQMRNYNPETDINSIIEMEEQISATLEKSRVNEQLADEADAVILWESEPGAMGRP